MVFTGLLLPQALLSCGLKVGPGFKERDFDAHSPLVCPLSSFFYISAQSGNVVEERRVGGGECPQ